VTRIGGKAALLEETVANVLLETSKSTADSCGDVHNTVAGKDILAGTISVSDKSTEVAGLEDWRIDDQINPQSDEVHPVRNVDVIWPAITSRDPEADTDGLFARLDMAISAIDSIRGRIDARSGRISKCVRHIMETRAQSVDETDSNTPGQGNSLVTIDSRAVIAMPSQSLIEELRAWEKKHKTTVESLQLALAATETQLTLVNQRRDVLDEEIKELRMDLAAKTLELSCKTATEQQLHDLKEHEVRLEQLMEILIKERDAALKDAMKQKASAQGLRGQLVGREKALTVEKEKVVKLEEELILAKAATPILPKTGARRPRPQNRLQR
jgi:hypothetical protein